MGTVGTFCVNGVGDTLSCGWPVQCWCGTKVIKLVTGLDAFAVGCDTLEDIVEAGVVHGDVVEIPAV